MILIFLIDKVEATSDRAKQSKGIDLKQSQLVPIHVPTVVEIKPPVDFTFDKGAQLISQVTLLCSSHHQMPLL